MPPPALRAGVLLLGLTALAGATVTTTGLSLPPDANLAEDRGVYFIDSFLRFESVPAGTRTLTRAEALVACGDSFSRARWTPYRLQVYVPTVIRIPVPASYDGTRVASRLQWWVCGNGTHVPASETPVVTWVRADGPGVYVLAAGDCAGGFDCYECTAPGGGCDCRGDKTDAYDVGYTVAVSTLLGMARAIRIYRSSSQYQAIGKQLPWTDPHAQLHALELIGYSVAAAHSIDIALRWGWDEPMAIAGVAAASAMALLTLIAFLTARDHADPSPPPGAVEQAWDLLLVTVFSFYTLSSVVLRRPHPIVSFGAALILACFIFLTISSNIQRKSLCSIMGILQALSVVGVACYALPFMGGECDSRFV